MKAQQRVSKSSVNSNKTMIHPSDSKTGYTSHS